MVHLAWAVFGFLIGGCLGAYVERQIQRDLKRESGEEFWEEQNRRADARRQQEEFNQAQAGLTAPPPSMVKGNTWEDLPPNVTPISKLPGP
jgi:hypothetical protein